MMKPETIINAITRPLRLGDFGMWDKGKLATEIHCHITPSKFVRGDGDIGPPVPLDAALTEECHDDHHFTQYTSPQNVRCVKAGSYELSFKLAAYDADFGGHTCEPTREDFARLVRVLAVIDEKPNVVYETKHGARILYLISEITDAEEFEHHYAALLTRLGNALTLAELGYQIDGQTKDWTRLFRAPLVVRDGVEEYERMVQLFCTTPIDLRTFKAKPKPVRRLATGNARYDGNDLKLLRLLRVEMLEGNRNHTAFKAVCHARREYSGDDLDTALAAIESAALAAGLDEREVQQIITSASKQERKPK